MRYIKSILQISGLLLFSVLLSSCGTKKEMAEEKAMEKVETPAIVQKKPAKPELPMRYQRPAYMIGEEIQLAPVEEGDDVALKVGATIRSTTGPQPLWDILKRLAAMKGMNVSWESDVDQNVLVDVDINAKDDFYKAINNLLRQVDYYHEMQGETIVVKYKETRKFLIGMPNTKQLFETGTGGDVLGGGKSESNVEGTIRLDSKGNEYDIWKNIEENLNAILDVWTTEEVTQTGGEQAADANNTESVSATGQDEAAVAAGTRRRSGNQNGYIIDRSIGQITVTAPRPLLERIDAYIKSLKEHLYKQISIEAKIIEVVTSSESNIGINWDQVLKNFSLSGSLELGGTTGLLWSSDSSDNTKFISKIGINDTNWTALINALEEQGEARVLSNPKISVMNGQPALISVGRNVAYIESIETEENLSGGSLRFKQTVNTERVLSGLGLALKANIIDDDEVIMNLVPVVSELEGGVVNNVVYDTSTGALVGLPVINIREMSTTVKVKSGEMLVIGGLISDNNEDTSSFAPGLGDVPLIKYLFGYEKKEKLKRELIILLRPVII